jgi:ankyrin repeat protein
MISAITGATESADHMLKAGASPEGSESSRDDAAPLVMASFRGNMEMVDMLIKNGADIDVRAEGSTPLQVAAINSRLDVVRRLLKAGADPNATFKEGGKKGLTPLAFCAGLNLTDAIKVLIEGGARVNKITKEGTSSPLFVAVREGHVEAVQVLLKNGTDPNLQHKRGLTPLMAAAAAGEKKAAGLLLKNGADPAVEGPRNMTAAEVADLRDNNQVEKMIEEAVAKKQTS